MIVVDLKFLLSKRGWRLSKLAGELGVHKANATRWHQHGIPAMRAVDIERVAGIPRHELRPDLWPAPRKTEAA